MKVNSSQSKSLGRKPVGMSIWNRLLFSANLHLMVINSEKLCEIQADIGRHCRNKSQAVATPLRLQM